MAISAQHIKELRDRTGAPIGDCKKALDETNDDVEASVELLRKQGLAKAASKAGRAARDGRIELVVADGARSAALVEVNCETDFVARTDVFQELAKSLGRSVLKASAAPATVEEALALPGEDASTIQEMVTLGVQRTGENVKLGRVARLDCEGPGRIGSYLHFNARVGVIVRLACAGEVASDNAELADLGKQLAMHITMAAPEVLTWEDLDAQRVEKERAVLLDTTKQEKPDAPEAALEKIVEGRLRKFREEICLLDQIWIHDEKGKSTVAEILGQASKSVGCAVSVTGFARFSLDDTLKQSEE